MIDMPISNEQLRQVLALAERLPGLPWDRRGGEVKTAAATLGISDKTLYRWMARVGHASGRKRRGDAGVFRKLDADQVRQAASLAFAGTRETGKRLPTFRMVLEIVNANARQDGAVDPETGEINARQMDVAPSTLARAMRQLGCHPTQLARPTPAHPQKSRHPNHVWQVDVSTCVLFYLSNGGVEICDVAAFNKNKPSSYERVKEMRVQRYLAVDHCTGAFHLAYLPGHETTRNLLDFLIPAFHPRPGTPFHGVPKILMVDPGSAQAAPVFRNLARALDLKVLVHEAGNPRAKGSVESSHNVIERLFEGRLIGQTVHDFAHLNALADDWSRVFQSVKPHSRHGMPRFDAFMRIKPDELRLAPGLETTRALVISDPVSRIVTSALTISYAPHGHGQHDYLVKDLPGVAQGETLWVVGNPYRLPAIDVLIADAEGREVRHFVAPIPKDDWGFDGHAAVIDEEYKSLPDTFIDRERKGVLRATWGTDDAREIAKRRRGKAVAFDGTLDTFADVKATPVPDYLPRRGTALDVAVPVLAETRMTATAAAIRLQGALGDAWRPEYYPWLVQRFTDGIGEEQYARLEALWRDGDDTDHDKPREATC